MTLFSRLTNATSKFCILLTIILNFWAYQAIGQNEELRLFSHQTWISILDKPPVDQRKWDEFEIFARMYARYAIPEEKTLPLVFNVINISGGTKISENDILGQISEINKAFSGLNENKTGREYSRVSAGDTKLRFCLGNPPDGGKAITIIEKDRAYRIKEFEMISDAKEGLEGAPRLQYINIWVTELPDSLGGLAFQPNRDEKMDGIYIDPDFFGLKPESKMYDKGRTIIHLLGKYLSLHPLWTNQECVDDGIEDTPIHNAPNYRCYEYSHISTCTGNEEEMIGNYMDAGPDDCAFMFSNGQVARIHACLGENGYRKELLLGKIQCAENNNLANKTEPGIGEELFDFEIVPNPAYEFIEIIYQIPKESEKTSVHITNEVGIVVRSQQLPLLWEKRGHLKIDINNLKNGIYLISLQTGDLNLTKKLIKL